MKRRFLKIDLKTILAGIWLVKCLTPNIFINFGSLPKRLVKFVLFLIIFEADQSLFVKYSVYIFYTFFLFIWFLQSKSLLAVLTRCCYGEFAAPNMNKYMKYLHKINTLLQVQILYIDYLYRNGNFCKEPKLPKLFRWPVLRNKKVRGFFSYVCNGKFGKQRFKDFRHYKHTRKNLPSFGSCRIYNSLQSARIVLLKIGMSLIYAVLIHSTLSL